MRRLTYLAVDRYNPLGTDGVSRTALEALAWLAGQGVRTEIRAFYTRADPLARFLLRWAGAPPDARVVELVQAGVAVRLERLEERGPQAVLAAVTGHLRGAGDLGGGLVADGDLTSQLALCARGIAAAHWFHSPAAVDQVARHPVARGLLRDAPVLAVSAFLEGEIRARLGLPSRLVRPLVPGAARPREAAPGRVGYYSAGRHKGDPVLRRLVARLPDHAFAVAGRAFTGVRGPQPDNLTCLGEVWAPDLLWERTGALIAPSIEPEGFSRVVVEACLRGLPVVANAVGGLPEALGDGGALVPFAPGAHDACADAYVTVLRRLRDDPAAWQTARARALERGRRWADGLEDRGRALAAALA